MSTKTITKAFPAINVMFTCGDDVMLDVRKIQQEIKKYPSFSQLKDNDSLFNYDVEIIKDLDYCIKNFWGNTVKISSNEYVPISLVEKFIVIKDFFLYKIDVTNTEEDRIIYTMDEKEEDEEEPKLNMMDIERFSETTI